MIGSPIWTSSSACSRVEQPMSSHWSLRSGRLGALVLGHLVGWLAADHAVHGALGGLDDEVAAGEELRVHAADLVERDEALLVDVGDDEADLVRVGGDDDVRRTLALDRAPDVAQRVALGRRQRGETLAHAVEHGGFEPGGGGGGAEVAQQVEVGRHGVPPDRSCARAAGEASPAGLRHPTRSCPRRHPPGLSRRPRPGSCRGSWPGTVRGRRSGPGARRRRRGRACWRCRR